MMTNTNYPSAETDMPGFYAGINSNLFISSLAGDDDDLDDDEDSDDDLDEVDDLDGIDELDIDEVDETAAESVIDDADLDDDLDLDDDEDEDEDDL